MAIDYETTVLIHEAASKGKKMLETKKMPEVLSELKKEYMLSPEEITALEAEIVAPETSEKLIEEKPEDRFESIYFKSIEEAQQAEGILMYKRIPWKEKGTEGSAPFIQFDNSQKLKEAQDALQRRWDFVEKSPRRVAVVEFDDLTMYQRVVEYMEKTGMLIDFGSGSHDLQEDVHNAVAPKGKKVKESRYSFFARPRSERPNLEKLSETKELRTCHVRRRFK